MTNYDPRDVKRVVLYLTEDQFQELWKMAFRRNERSGIANQVSVSKLIRSLANGNYRLVKREPLRKVRDLGVD